MRNKLPLRYKFLESFFRETDSHRLFSSSFFYQKENNGDFICFFYTAKFYDIYDLRLSKWQKDVKAATI